MITRVQRWGNSQGLRLAKGILQDARIQVGDDVDVTVRDGAIVVSLVCARRGRHRLEDLVARVPRRHGVAETEWGPPVGKEVW